MNWITDIWISNWITSMELLALIEYRIDTVEWVIEPKGDVEAPHGFCHFCHYISKQSLHKCQVLSVPLWTHVHWVPVPTELIVNSFVHNSCQDDRCFTSVHWATWWIHHDTVMMNNLRTVMWNVIKYLWGEHYVFSTRSSKDLTPLCCIEQFTREQICKVLYVE